VALSRCRRLVYHMFDNFDDLDKSTIIIASKSIIIIY
jgi:hypothetical protein